VVHRACRLVNPHPAERPASGKPEQQRRYTRKVSPFDIPHP
jgi:hypothetical protein